LTILEGPYHMVASCYISTCINTQSLNNLQIQIQNHISYYGFTWHLNVHGLSCFGKVGFWVCWCVWGFAKLVLICPCKFVRKFFIILFSLYKMFKPIPWNDCNFSLVIKIINCWFHLRCLFKHIYVI
jgi:hypothetical protein